MLHRLLTLFCLASCIFGSAASVACESFDLLLSPVGVIESSNQSSGYMSDGNKAFLAAMLGAAYARTNRDPRTLAVRVNIESQSEKMKVTHVLDSGTRGFTQEADVRCLEGYWHLLISGTTSAEGAYRSYQTDIRFEVTPNGELKLLYEDRTRHGLIFRSDTSTTFVARFSKVGNLQD